MSVYNISNIAQSIDLNGESVNFRIYLTIESEKKEPFYVSIVTEKQIEDDSKIDFKLVENGFLETEIIKNDNEYQNYILMIRAENPCKCLITIKKEDLQPNNNPNKIPPDHQNENSISKRWIFLAIIALLCILAYFYFKSENGATANVANVDIFEKLKQLS